MAYVNVIHRVINALDFSTERVATVEVSEQINELDYFAGNIRGIGYQEFKTQLRKNAYLYGAVTEEFPDKMKLRLDCIYEGFQSYFDVYFFFLSSDAVGYRAEVRKVIVSDSRSGIMQVPTTSMALNLKQASSLGPNIQLT